MRTIARLTPSLPPGRLDQTSFLLGFETGNDEDFDDLVLKIQYNDTGQVLLTVVSRHRKGKFDLLDIHGRTLLRNLGRKKTPAGSTFELDAGVAFSTPDDGTHQVVTSPGQSVENVNFGLYHSGSDNGAVATLARPGEGV